MIFEIPEPLLRGGGSSFRGSSPLNVIVELEFDGNSYHVVRVLGRSSHFIENWAENWIEKNQEKIKKE